MPRSQIRHRFLQRKKGFKQNIQNKTQIALSTDFSLTDIVVQNKEYLLYEIQMVQSTNKQGQLVKYVRIGNDEEDLTFKRELKPPLSVASFLVGQCWVLFFYVISISIIICWLYFYFWFNLNIWKTCKQLYILQTELFTFLQIKIYVPRIMLSKSFIILERLRPSQCHTISIETCRYTFYRCFIFINFYRDDCKDCKDYENSNSNSN